MCEAPPRHWRNSLTPQRCLRAVAGSALMVVGAVLRHDPIGLLLIALGALALLNVAGWVVTEAEFGLPPKVRWNTTRKARQDDLARAFTNQQAALEFCATRLCDDPATAAKLLGVAVGQVTSHWRGPVNDDQIRILTLCWFVQRLIADSRLTGAAPSEQIDAANRLLAQLSQIQRIALVLNEFERLHLSEIAEMVGLSTEAVRAELARGEEALAALAAGGGTPHA